MQTGEQEFFRVRLEELGDLKKLRMAPPIKYQSQPYLSIVAASRNDNHGGDLLNRMQYFIDGLLKQAEKFELPIEIVLVEWNPPANRPSLSDVLRWGTQNEYCTIRIIEVPPKIHRRYQHSTKLPLYQMIAKNVGIRRARGNFVLATNIDILFPDELFSFLASDRLTEGKIYRANRLDVKEDPAGRLSIDELLSFCKQHIIRVNDKYGSHNLITGDYHRIYPHGCDNHPDYLTTIEGIALNTNACGDFQLMARRHWTELKGYPELDMFSFHLDSVFEYMAHFKGIVEETLPDQMGIFHLEHTEGWTPEIHRNKTMDTKLEKENIPRLSSQQFYSLRVQMADGKGAGIFNGDNWGLGSDSLKENVVKHAKWERNCHSEKGFLSKPAEQAQEIRLLNAHSIDQYLSIVVTARNDNHGGNMLHRMQTFVDGLYSQCQTYDVDAELIIVEWNPPRNRKRISEVIEWQKVSTPLTVRIIEVSPEIHCRIGNSDKIPLFQMIAKNVGIQRARGKFVLATCIDILFSDELMWFLSKKQLDEDCFYRICRYDVGSKVIPVDDSIEQRLEFCWQNAIRFQGLNGTEDIGENANKISHIWKGRDFFKLSEKEIIALLKKESEGKKLFTNACGDFTMMARDKWFSLRGHPELPKWSIYLDGVFLHMAYVSGLRQIILPDPMKIYHIEHDMGWAVTQAPINERPSLDYQKEYLPWCNKMLKEKRPLNPNNENWGMAKENLKELTIKSKGKETRNGAMRVFAPRGNFSEQPNKMPSKFQEWIDKLGAAQNQLYYRDQTPSSLGYLFEIAKRYKPTKIIELGTLSGLSLRTWSLTDSAAEIIAIDLSFAALRQSQQIISVDLSRVKLLEQDILKTDFSRLWGPNDRVLLYVDAHDMPNVPIMDYILKTAVPALTPGSMVVVDDLWHSPACLNGKSARQFFESTVIKEIDPLQCFQGYYASYWKGGSFFGFREVIPLLEWVNNYKVDLVFEPGIKSVTFEWKQPRPADSSMDSRKFARLCGKIKYNPVDNRQNTEEVPTQADQQALALCNQGVELYAAFQMDLAMACFQRASALSTSVSGILHAQGVILARAGKFERALKVLEKDVANPAPHSNSRILLEDIQAWMNKGIRSRVRGNCPIASKPITIFAIPKGFKGHTDIIQRNAIKSWTLLQPRPEIILFGDDKGTSEIAQEFGLRHVPDVKQNEYGSPLVNDLFAQAEGMATNNILAYINADIILMSDFMPVVNIVRTQFAEFLMIGQRWDVNIHSPVNFDSSTWEEYLHKIVTKSGVLHIPRGLDYFVFSKHLWKKIPAFAIGRTAWDNWLAYQPIVDQHPVVDATESIITIHQNHDYSHLAAKKDEVWKGEEARNNQYLAGERVCKGMGSALAATWQLTKCGLEQRIQPQYALQHKKLFSKLEQKNWSHKYLSYKPYFESVSYLNCVQSPAISIVVISWRLRHEAIKNLQILQQQRRHNFELIFVNNGSSSRILRKVKPFIDIYIKLSENTGAYRARNIGALFAISPILLFLDDDALSGDNLVVKHIEIHQQYPEIVGIRGKCLPKDKENSFAIAPHYDLGDTPTPYYLNLEGNLSIKTDTFYKIEGFSDEIFFGYGGAELSYRLKMKAGINEPTWYFPDPVIYHDYSSNEDNLEEKKKSQNRSLELVKKKYEDFDEYLGNYRKLLINVIKSKQVENYGEKLATIKFANFKKNILIEKLEEKNWEYKKDFYEPLFEYVQDKNLVKPPDVSVVVISWRLHPDNLMSFEILEKQRDQNFELIFVNNGGKEGEFNVLKPFIDTYIKLNTNTGAYLARNVGSLFANAPIIFFLEDDGIPTHDIIKAHLQAFRKYDIICCRGVYFPKTDNPLNEIATHYYLGDKEYPIFADLEGNTTYRADIFYAAGGWDDNIQYGGGGVELSIRLSKIETDLRKQIYSPAPVIYHDYATDDDHLKAKTEKQKKSRLYLKEKHPEWDHFISHYETYKKVSPLLKIKHSSPSQDLKITVCIPTFNRAGYLRDAIQSALDQTWRNFKILIVDDGSEDNTRQVVVSFDDPRIQYVRNGTNQGRPITRNRAIRETQTEYILWLDDDDLLENSIVDRYMRLLEQDPTIDILYCNLQLFENESGKDLALFEAKDWSASREGLLESLVKGVGITNLGSCVRKSLYEKTGFYDEDFLRAQDYEFWSRAARMAEFRKVNAVLARCRRHTGNISLGPDVDNSYESLVIRKIAGAHPLRTIFPALDWSAPQKARQAALYQVARNLMRVKDVYNAAHILSGILEGGFHKEVLKDLMCCHLILGQIGKCEELIDRYKTNRLSDHSFLMNLKETIEVYQEGCRKFEQCLTSRQYDKADNVLGLLYKEYGPTYSVEVITAKCFEIAGKNEPACGHYELALQIRPDPKILAKVLGYTGSEAPSERIKERYARMVSVIPLFQENTAVEEDGLVSVIIPTYNRPEMLKDAITSVIHQTYKNFEIIIVNDAGVNVESIVTELNSAGNLRYIEHPENRGMAAARNTGIKHARGKYIALLDDDDLFYPTHLKTALDDLSDDTPVIYTDAIRATYRRVDGAFQLAGKKVPYSIDFDRDKLLIGNISPVNCFVFEKDSGLQAGLFDETFPVLEDWEFFIRLSELCAFKHINRVTTQVNWRGDGTSVTFSRGMDFKKNRERIYKRYRAEIGRIPNARAIHKMFQDIWREDNNPGEPLISIVVLAYNQLEYTKKCIESIVENTNVFFELILVDNGSTDGTATYLNTEWTSLRSADMLRIIKNDRNLGYARGNNQGMAIAKGDYILLLNNDVVVTPGWLNRLMECAEKNPDIGIVGPVSNFVVGPQLVEAVPYDLVSLDGLHKFAEMRGKEYAGQTKRLARVVGFCMLIKRDVVEKIGGLDTRYGLGNFEDDDFSLRAVLAGYGSCIAKDCFIHHFGNRTFVGSNINYHESLENNWEIFKEKWELPEELPYGSYYSIPNLLKGGFIPEKHFCSLGYDASEHN